MARAGEAPDVVLGAAYGWYRAADTWSTSSRSTPSRVPRPSRPWSRPWHRRRRRLQL